MRDPDAALARWVSRAPLWLRTLSLRRDLALPLVVLAVQLTGAAVSEGSAHVFNPPHAVGALGWVLLAAGPVALVARRRHPVPVLWVNVAGTLPWSSAAGWAHISFIVAFFAAATAGKRYSAWLALAICFAWTIWLAPLVYGYTIPPANDALLLAGWTVAVVIAAEAYRFRAERVAATRASRQIDQRRRQSEERLRVARDLHDVIGHNISLINVQASMGLDLLDSQPEQARAALSAIKSVSKEALEELRTMLTTLRHDDDVPHAGRARVTVRVTYDDADVHVEIDDDGKVPAGRAAAIGTGTGITGMRERAAALGGDLSAGFRHGGGFRVSARLPVRPAP